MAAVDNQYETITQEEQEYKKLFAEFIDWDHGAGKLKQRIEATVNKNETRVVANINDLRQFNGDLADKFMNSPNDYVVAFEAAVKDELMNIDTNFAKTSGPRFKIGWEGSFGAHHVSPRGLEARLLNTLVCVDGIVTKCSLVRPKVVMSTHYCEATDKLMTRTYRDQTTAGNALPTSTAYPTKDEQGNLLTTEYGLSMYKDHQTIAVQEMPERAPPGQLPRSVDIILEDDLVDKCKPGDRVQIIGLYRALGGAGAAAGSGVFRTVIIGYTVRKIGKEVYQARVTERDVRNIREISKKGNPLDLLAQSMAPSIYGHNFVKRALVLLLLGGVEKNLENGTHIRGDINMLMIGDPSVAKSQLLRFIMKIAPLAIHTTGRGSSGVGLTAAVTHDQETGERRLEAGAMVLADRGIVCIDEFDKMSDNDRVAIHEVMEQQTVTIAKAGIHTSLNARCSVLAAANPVYGQFNRSKTTAENIGLQDSLLSRFDMLFVLLDQMRAEEDRMIAGHVLRMHRYIKAGTEGNPHDHENTFLADTMMEQEESKDETAEVYQKKDKYLHTAVADKVLTVDFMKKYIHYAKERFKPQMTDEASARVAAAYCELREKEMDRTLPVTPRALETLIRISTAHAKARLDRTVSVKDVEDAYALMRFAMYREGEDRDEGDEDNRRSKSGTPGAKRNFSQSRSPSAPASKKQKTPDATPKKRPSQQRPSAPSDDPFGFDSDDDNMPSGGRPGVRRQRSKTPEARTEGATPMETERTGSSPRRSSRRSVSPSPRTPKSSSVSPVRRPRSPARTSESPSRRTQRRESPRRTEETPSPRRAAKSPESRRKSVSPKRSAAAATTPEPPAESQLTAVEQEVKVAISHFFSEKRLDVANRADILAFVQNRVSSCDNATLNKVIEHLATADRVFIDEDRVYFL